MRVTSTFPPAFVPAVRPARAAWIAAAGLLLACAPAHAQVGACEDLKARLAQRISGGPGSYVMEAVPAAAAVPSGVKVIGTCGGGAWKVLFRRGSAPIVLDGTTSAPAHSTSQGASAPASKPPRTEAASIAPLATTPASAPAAAVVARQEPARPNRSPASLPTPPQPDPPVRPPADIERSGEPALTPPVAATVGATEPSPEGDRVATPAEASTAGGWRAFVQRHRLWLAGLAGLPLAAWLYAWVARRRAYDEQGLPRGPRLN